MLSFSYIKNLKLVGMKTNFIITEEILIYVVKCGFTLVCGLCLCVCPEQIHLIYALKTNMATAVVNRK